MLRRGGRAGLRRTPAKRMWRKLHRGFESLLLRHSVDMPSPGAKVFYYSSAIMRSIFPFTNARTVFDVSSRVISLPERDTTGIEPGAEK
jgi:hypothetical protein